MRLGEQQAQGTFGHRLGKGAGGIAPGQALRGNQSGIDKLVDAGKTMLHPVDIVRHLWDAARAGCGIDIDLCVFEVLYAVVAGSAQVINHRLPGFWSHKVLHGNQRTARG